MNSLMSSSLRLKTSKLVRNKTILVTGGTGSFGKSIVLAMLRYKPKEIRVFSRSEDKQDKMRFIYANEPSIKYILGDVRDLAQVTRATKGADIVFHAAAQKQVPASEYNVLEAIHTNIIGAQNIIDACFTNNVKMAIAISTDKAVEPVNAMGMTKALQEKLFVSANMQRHRGGCRFSCVRYGNVLGSTGSVLEVFLKQLNEKKNLTITDAHMTRFLITLDQAVELVFLAMAESRGGEIFIPNIPTHNVVDLANALLQITTPKIGVPAKELRITGIRPGEKIHETLISPSESARTTIKKTHYVIHSQLPMGKNQKKFTDSPKHKLFRYSSDNGFKLSKNELIIILKKHLKDSGLIH